VSVITPFLVVNNNIKSMAKQRMINTRIWNDSWFRTINPLDRYLFLYFLSNSHTNICGIYELPIDTIAYETGIDFRDIEKSMLPKLEPKIYYIDSYVIIINFIKYQNYNSPKIKSGIMAEFNQIPIEIQNLAIGYGYHIDTISHSNSNLNSNINILSANADAKQQNNTSVKKRSEAQQVIDYWIEKYTNTFGDSPVVSWGKVVKLANPKVSQLGLDRMKHIIDRYFVCDEEIAKKNKWDIATMLSDFMINKLK
jgi:hypothetical protein